MRTGSQEPRWEAPACTEFPHREGALRLGGGGTQPGLVQGGRVEWLEQGEKASDGEAEAVISQRALNATPRRLN